DAAAKVEGPTTMTPPSPEASVLAEDWRTGAPAALAELGRAWQDPAAWEGMTQAGGQRMPAEVTAAVALDEVVLHGWDLAVATGQSYDADPAALGVVEEFCAQIGEDPAERGGLFGPRVPVPADAPQLDRVLGLAGRDPDWTPPEVCAGRAPSGGAARRIVHDRRAAFGDISTTAARRPGRSAPARARRSVRSAERLEGNRFVTVVDKSSKRFVACAAEPVGDRPGPCIAPS